MTPIKGQVITLTTNVKPDAQFRAFISAAKTAASASRMMVCGALAYLLNVNYFRTGKDELYLSRDAATTYLKEQLPKQADVKGGMLDIYISRASDLYGRITAPGGSKFKPLIQELVKLTDPDKVVNRLFKWMDQEAGIKSLTDLSMQLGYSVGSNAPTGGTKGTKQTAAKRVESLGTSVATIMDKVVGDKKNHVTSTQVNQVIAKKVSDPLDLAMQGIRAYAASPDADPDKLEAIIKLVSKMVDEITARQKKIAATAKKIQQSAKGKHVGKAAALVAAKAQVTGAGAGSGAVHAPAV